MGGSRYWHIAYMQRIRQHAQSRSLGVRRASQILVNVSPMDQETRNTLEDSINSSSDDFEGYASDARGEMSDTPCGNGYCCASDGLDSLQGVS